MNEQEFATFKKDIATTLKSAQKTLEHTAITNAKIAVKRAMKKNTNHDQQPENTPQITGPTMADIWLKTLENSAKNAISPLESLSVIEKMIAIEKNKIIENENKKKEVVYKSIVDNARHRTNVTTLLD